VSLPAGYQLASGTGVIGPLASLTFGITLAATEAGSFGGAVTITSDAPGQTVFTFPVTGLVLDPPVVNPLAASGLGAGLAALHASVNPSDSSTTVWFEWSKDPEFDGVTVRAVAGSVPGFADENGSAAKFDQPSGLATDADGNIYVADTLNHRIRKISPDGTASTFAGSGAAGSANGSAATAEFNRPIGIVMGNGGILLVTDSNNHRIRAITPAGEVSTYCGLGTRGFTDGVPAAARFDTPAGLAIAADGTLHVADQGNHRIRKSGPDGTASTLAGQITAGSTNGAASVAEFNNPVAIAVNSAGNAYVTEAASHAIRQVAPDGFTRIFAGSPTHPGSVEATGTTTRFSSPVGLAMRVDGTLLVVDKGNHRLRSVSQGTRP
jgi:sugar lactone lactonase YvrE